MNLLIYIKNILILLLSLFFLVLGANTLIGSYRINNPIEFLMYFFSASLLILICLTGLIYCYFRFFPKKNPDEVNNETK